MAGKQIPPKWRIFDAGKHELTRTSTFKLLTWIKLTSSCSPNNTKVTNIEQYVNDGSNIGLRYEPSTGFIMDPWVPSTADAITLY